MNERIKELWSQAGGHYNSGNQHTWPEYTITDPEKFAELIVQECTQVLFDESEKLFELYSEETNMRTAQEYEIRSNQCIDNIALIQKHFGVEE